MKLKNSAFLSCLASSDEWEELLVADGSGAGYFETGAHSVDTFVAISKAAKAHAAKEYRSKYGRPLLVMKCLDFYNSEELDELVRNFDGDLAVQPALSPGEVVRVAYAAANQGNYEEADAFLSAMFANDEDERFWRDGSPKDWWDRHTRRRTLERVEILSQENDGLMVVVTLRRYYADQASDEWSHQLSKEGGAWRINPVTFNY